MMKTLSLLFLLITLPVLGQVSFSGAKLSGFSVGPPPASNPTPTTLSGGEAPLLWVKAIMGTNGSNVIVTNLASTGSGYNLTNNDVVSSQPVAGSDGGNPTLSLIRVEATYLRNNAFTNDQAGGLTWGMVIAYTNFGSGVAYILDQTNIVNPRRGICSFSGNFIYYDGTTIATLCPLDGLTNSWISLIFHAPPNGTGTISSYALYTNGVSAGTVTTAEPMDYNGLVLGARGDISVGANYAFKDFEVYTNLSSQSIADLHTYHKTLGTP